MIPVKEKKISLSAAAILIKESKGKFFTIEFNKKADGTKRTMNCRFEGVTALGNLQVKERSEHKQIDPRTIKRLKINKEIYSIKK